MCQIMDEANGLDEVKKLSKEAKYICKTCGKVSTRKKYLCDEVRI